MRTVRGGLAALICGLILAGCGGDPMEGKISTGGSRDSVQGSLTNPGGAPAADKDAAGTKKDPKTFGPGKRQLVP